jgi:hypothetical protein
MLTNLSALNINEVAQTSCTKNYTAYCIFFHGNKIKMKNKIYHIS